MNKQFLVATLAAALMAPVASYAVDATLYGRIVVGVDRQDSDNQGESATWDLGATGKDGSANQQSRLGFKADHELDNGMNVGFKIEQGFDGNGGPNNQRHRYVSLSGGFGTITVGNQNNPYLMGANWAQEWYLGGNTVGSFREEGIGYAMNRGPFSLNVLLTGDNGGHVTLPTRTSTTAIETARESEAAYLARVQAALARVPTTAPMTGDAEATGTVDGTFIGTDARAQMTGEADLTYADRLRTIVNRVTGGKDIDARPAAASTETDDALRIRLAESLGMTRGTRANGVAETDAQYLMRIRNEGETDDQFLTRLQNAVRDADSAAIRAAEATNRTADEEIDRTIIGASYDFGIVKVGVGYNKDNTENDYDWFSVGASGSAGQFGYYVGWQQKDDARSKVAGTNIGQEDQDGWGTFLYYDVNDADRVYLEYETLENDWGANDEVNHLILGYSHNFGGGVRFIGEYRTTDNNGALDDDGVELGDPTRLALTMMVGF